MKNENLFSESNSATYCPEDNKLRLYVGRVPRNEYEALKAEGWTSTPKQDCDFVAHWTPSRRDTCLSYAGFIADEDTPPTERAADRAERFAGYQEKRFDEATQHADRYESGPAAHGYQSERRAERAAARHDRLGDKASDQWSKAEYWSSRTAGVISHALYKSEPGVRMGRIKELEAELRKMEKSQQEVTERAQRRFDAVLSVLEHAEGKREKLKPIGREDFVWSLSKIRRAEGDTEDATPEQYRRACLESALSGYHNSDANQAKAKEAEQGTRPAADIAREWLEGKTRPADWDAETGTEWTRHLKLRLSYENQMLEAQGGRAGAVEMIPGGWLGKYQIQKVNKSNVTGRVVSVDVQYMSATNRWGNPWQDGKGPRMLAVQIKVERMAADTYRAPTEAELATFSAERDAAKKAAKATAPPSSPLINPTDVDAERLQALINERHVAEWKRRYGEPRGCHAPKTAEVHRMTQAEYSAISTGAYAKAETRTVHAAGLIGDRESNLWSQRAQDYKKMIGAPLCKVRFAGYDPIYVLIITDKPQKPLPAAVWEVKQETATLQPA
jgi:hypothetical protein